MPEKPASRTRTRKATPKPKPEASEAVVEPEPEAPPAELPEPEAPPVVIAEPEADPVRIAATMRAVPFLARWAAAQAEVKRVAKNGFNTQQKYNFASVEDILDAIRLPLLTRGIVLTQTMDHNLLKVEEIVSSNNTKGQRMTVWVDFVLRDAWSDQTIEAQWPGVGEDYGDKAIGKALTSAMKTWLRGTWLLPTGDDPEESGPVAKWWELDADPNTQDKAVGHLTDLLGRDNARQLLKNLAAQLDGKLPVSALVGAREVALAVASISAESTRAADAARAAQDAAGEAVPAIPSDDAPVARIPTPDERPFPTPEERAEPGTLLPPVSPSDNVTPDRAIELFIAAGCICADPITGDPAGHRLDCPIAGHGVPYDQRRPDQPGRPQ